MSETIQIQIDPDIINDREKIRVKLEEKARARFDEFEILRRSVDARSKRPGYTLQVALISGETGNKKRPLIRLTPVKGNRTALVVGAGPAGLFAALTLIEQGIKPIVIERGKPAAVRRKDITALLRTGQVNPESNYCFGEGGAGTFSDGKLYTRATKRGDVSAILDIFISHGAHESISIDAHPHIGSNRLPAIIERMRESLLQCGGEIHFECRVTDLVLQNGRIRGVMVNEKRLFEADAVILATGHSARDIYDLLSDKNLEVLPKPFAVGVRVEHPQALIDAIQYHHPRRHPNLPPAEYRFVSRIEDRGVYSFCMCPGGHIIPAATLPGELVVNGMSNAARNSPFANSGVVVEIQWEDIPAFHRHGAFAFLAFQKDMERRAFEFGGASGLQAPAQILTDFIAGKTSSRLPKTSYLPGVTSAPLRDLFPPAITRKLKLGFEDFGRKRKGFVTDEALLIAVESRTSAPLMIPRDKDTRMHPQVQGLYPCGEGAGYAGGIVSSALDGRQSALSVSTALRTENKK